MPLRRECPHPVRIALLAAGLFAAAALPAAEPSSSPTRDRLAQLAQGIHYFETKNLINNRPPYSIFQPDQKTFPAANGDIYDQIWPESLLDEHSQLIAGLRALGPDRDALAACLQDPDPQIRTLALGALFEREDGRDLALIASLLNDDAPTFPVFNQVEDWSNHSMALRVDPRPQTVGQVAQAMLACYLGAAGYGNSSYPSDYSAAAIIAKNFADYWPSRAHRAYCASWFLVKMNRAYRQQSPVDAAYAPDIHRVLAAINALPSADAALTNLYVLRNVVFSEPNEILPDAAQVAAVKPLGAPTLLRFLQRQPVSDDPDLQFVNPSRERYPFFENMANFVLAHATNLLRPEDANALLVCESLEENNHLASGRPYRWAAAAAELAGERDPAQAGAIVRAALLRYPLSESTEATAEGCLLAALWSVRGLDEKDFIIDWFYSVAPSTSSGDLGGLWNFLGAVHDANRPGTPALMAAFFADPRFDQLEGERAFEQLFAIADLDQPTPLLSLRDIYDQSRPGPNQDAVFASWRALLRQHYHLSVTPPPAAPASALPVVTQPAYSVATSRPRNNAGIPALLAAGGVIALISYNGVEFHDATSGAVLWRVRVSPAVAGFAFAPAPGRFFLIDDNGHVFDGNVTAKSHVPYSKFPASLDTLAINPAGTVVVNASNVTLSIYDLQSTSLLGQSPLRAAGPPVFSPDGRLLAVIVETSEGNSTADPPTPGLYAIQLIDAASGARLRQFYPTLDRLTDLAFSPDGRSLASANIRDGARLWNVATGALQTQCTAPFMYATRAPAFSPDGHTLAVGVAGSLRKPGVIALFDTTTGALRAKIQPLATPQSLAFSPDGKTLYTLNRQLSAWPVP